MSTTVAGPIYDVDFSAPEVNKDPFPYYREMRELAPAVFNPPTGWWMVSSYDNVRMVLGREDLFGPEVEYFEFLFGARVFEAMDREDHDRVRAIWKPHFLRAVIEERLPIVERVIDELLDAVIERLQDGEVVDVLPDFLNPLPARVIAIMLGLPLADFPQFEEWNRGITGINVARSIDQSGYANELRERGFAANTALREYFGRELEERRRSGTTDDLIGVMANTDVEITEEQKRAHCTQLVWAGSDTTAKFLSNTMTALAEHPDQRGAVTDDRSLVPQALEEVLRHRSLATALPRMTRDQDVVLGDVSLPANQRVIGMTAAANRDPDRWEDPDRFDIHRPQKAHLGFGTGIHSCIGVHLARLEAAVWLNKVLDRMPEYQLAVDEVDYGTNIMTRGPMTLPISL
jgi:cytochrome P450